MFRRSRYREWRSAATSHLKSALPIGPRRAFPLVSNLYADSHLVLLQHNEMPKTVQRRKMRRDNWQSQEQANLWVTLEWKRCAETHPGRGGGSGQTPGSWMNAVHQEGLNWKLNIEILRPDTLAALRRLQRHQTHTWRVRGEIACMALACSHRITAGGASNETSNRLSLN